ncbi:MAG: 3-oxoacyl-ACP synthase, partial [Lachnospiraceae bacterium]
MDHIRILALGQGRAQKTVTNDDLSRVVDTSDAWIFPRTGIRSRQICEEGENSLTLAKAAAQNALDHAAARYGIRPEDIG